MARAAHFPSKAFKRFNGKLSLIRKLQRLALQAMRVSLWQVLPQNTSKEFLSLNYFVSFHSPFISHIVRRSFGFEGPWDMLLRRHCDDCDSPFCGNVAGAPFCNDLGSIQEKSSSHDCEDLGDLDYLYFL